MRNIALFLLPVVLVVASAGAQDDRTPEDRVAEFRRFYNRDNVKVRRAAVQDFKGTDGLDAAQLFVGCFKDKDPEVRALAQEGLGMIRDKKAVEWLLRKARLGGSAELKARFALAFGGMKHKSVLPTLLQLIGHRDAQIRHNAVKALGQQRNKKALKPLIDLLGAEKEDLVRQALFETLGNIGDKQASPAIEKQLGVGHWAVRVAAVEALAKLRTKTGVGALIARMQKEKGRLLTDIRKALEALTGETRFRENKKGWQEWWTKYHTQFKVPDKAYLAELKRKQTAAAEAYGAAPRKYHNIETWSQNMVFAIDVSGSMNDKVVLPPGREEAFFKKYKSRVKIDIVKQELIDLVAELKPNVNFKIITFASKVRPWSKRLQRATPGTKAKAIKKLDSLVVQGAGGSGGAGGRGGGGGGGRGAMNLSSGRTNTWGALMAGLKMPKTGRDKSGRLVKSRADTFFFLSDGLPTIGEVTDPTEILRRVQRFNATRRIVIHTIGFDKASRQFMKHLAETSGGTSVLIGG